MTEGLSVQMAIILQNWPASNQPLLLLPRPNCQCKIQQTHELQQAEIKYNNGRKREGNKMQENKAGKTKENSRQENHQGREIGEVETKIPLPPQKATTPIPAMMDQTMAVGEAEEVTQVGNLTEVTLSTAKSVGLLKQ